MSARAAALLVIVAAGLCGCVTSSIEQLRQGPRSTGISADEAMVVLGRRQHGDQFTEHDFGDCVADSLAASDITVVPHQEFEDAMFPWFEPRTAPESTDALPTLLDDPVIGRRLRETGVRYVVWLDGATTDGDSGGSMGCAIGPGGGGCLGFAWWEKRSDYRASVWDLETAQAVGQLSIDASGTSYLPAIIIPVPLLARTQATACGDLAKHIREIVDPNGAAGAQVASCQTDQKSWRAIQKRWPDAPKTSAAAGRCRSPEPPSAAEP